MTELKGVIALITQRINKNMNRWTLAYGNEKYIPSLHAVALLPSQRRTGETPQEVSKWLNK